MPKLIKVTGIQIVNPEQTAVKIVADYDANGFDCPFCKQAGFTKSHIFVGAECGFCKAKIIKFLVDGKKVFSNTNS